MVSRSQRCVEGPKYRLFIQLRGNKKLSGNSGTVAVVVVNAAVAAIIYAIRPKKNRTYGPG